MRPRNSGGGIASTLSCRRLVETRKDTTRMPSHLHTWVHLLSLASCFDGSFAWSAGCGVSKWSKFLTPPKIPRPDSATDGVMPKRQTKPVTAFNAYRYVMPLGRRSGLSLGLYRDFGDADESQSRDDEVDDKAPKTLAAHQPALMLATILMTGKNSSGDLFQVNNNPIYAARTTSMDRPPFLVPNCRGYQMSMTLFLALSSWPPSRPKTSRDMGWEDSICTSPSFTLSMWTLITASPASF